MKTKLLIISFVALCLSAAPTMADYNGGPIIVDRVTNYFSGSGGEFTLSTATLTTNAYSTLAATQTKDIYIDGAMTTSFQSFCVETNEFVSPPGDLMEQTVVNESGSTGSQAVAGGSFPSPNPDPLDPRTAYLYTQFAKGVLSNYDYNSASNRASDAEELQKAIWFIEQENGGSNTGKAGAWITEAQGEIDSGAWTGIGKVRVLNLKNLEFVPGVGLTLVEAQDMLYLVPVPGAVLLGILGLSVAGIKLRKYA